MTPNERDQDPHETPGFDRVPGIDDPVPDAEYENQRYRPEQEITDAGRGPVDEFLEYLVTVGFAEKRAALR